MDIDPNRWMLLLEVLRQLRVRHQMKPHQLHGQRPWLCAQAQWRPCPLSKQNQPPAHFRAVFRATGWYQGTLTEGQRCRKCPPPRQPHARSYPIAAQNAPAEPDAGNRQWHDAAAAGLEQTRTKLT